MTPDQMAVTVIGVSLMAFVAWFFWVKTGRGTYAAATNEWQEAVIVVKGGYTPDTIIVKKGRPVRLHFRRDETAACSEMVLFPDFGVSAHLPTGETVPIEFTPGESGEFEFACQMGMLRGRLIVE